MKKQYYIILDTETANSVEQPLPYDFGWVVIDRQGNIYEKFSYVIAEIYCDERDLMKTAYYAEKLPKYEKEIRNKERILASIWTARKSFISCMKKYDTSFVCAYNMGFDKRALNNDIRYISKSWLRWFFPYGTEFKCIWHMACTCVMNRPSYIKFAKKEGLVSEAGNIKTNAEACYRYIKGDITFTESHTGLEDCLIEAEIMTFCFRQHKKFDDSINSACWRKVQKVR